VAQFQYSILLSAVKTLPQQQQQQPFNGHLSRNTQVSQYQKGKTNLGLLEQETVSGSGISWAIHKSAPHLRQITMPAPQHKLVYGWIIRHTAQKTDLPVSTTQGLLNMVPFQYIVPATSERWDCLPS